MQCCSCCCFCSLKGKALRKSSPLSTTTISVTMFTIMMKRVVARMIRFVSLVLNFFFNYYLCFKLVLGFLRFTTMDYCFLTGLWSERFAQRPWQPPWCVPQRCGSHLYACSTISAAACKPRGDRHLHWWRKTCALCVCCGMWLCHRTGCIVCV